MAIKRASLNGAVAVATWLNANATAFFSSVTCEGSGSSATVKMYDKDNNEVFRSYSQYCQAYRASGNYIQSSAIMSTADRFANSEVILCDNGFILVSNPSGSSHWALLISQTNNGKLAIIFSDAAATSYTPYTTDIQHVALGDSTTIATKTSFTREVQQQTSFATFCTNADAGVPSYTPKAFYMPVSQVYGNGMGKFIIGTDTYITNGYWAIKDGGAT